MSKSNKPSWSEAPEWAKWLACDGAGKHQSQWWWFPEKPSINLTPGIWWVMGVLPAKFSGYSADPEWAKENWEGSLEKRPSVITTKPQNEYLISDDKRRVTLFIDFDGSVQDDKELSRNIAEMICNRLNGGHTYPGDKFTPGGSSVDGIRIAIGTCKTDEILYDDGFYIKGDHHE